MRSEGEARAASVLATDANTTARAAFFSHRFQRLELCNYRLVPTRLAASSICSEESEGARVCVCVCVCDFDPEPVDQ